MVLEGSLVVRLAAKVVGNGLEAYFLTFGAREHPPWTILGSFGGNFGLFWAPFWPFLAHFGTNNGGYGGQKGVPEGPKWDQSGPKMSRNYVETL